MISKYVIYVLLRLYDVIIEACTEGGCRKSAAKSVRTLEAPPAGMQAPELHNTSPNSIEVSIIINHLEKKEQSLLFNALPNKKEI